MSNFYTCRIHLTLGDVQLEHALQCSLLVKDSFYAFKKKKFDINRIDQSNHLVNKKIKRFFMYFQEQFFFIHAIKSFIFVKVLAI